MSLKLIDPVNSMPLFQPNQVLTYNHLNDLATYLYQQERYTRNKLIGSGIVCGLGFNWQTVSSAEQVVIDEGIAVASAGYLIVFLQPVNSDGTIIPYTHKREFKRLKDVPPFKNVPGIANKTVFELITLDQFNAETEIQNKGLIAGTDKNNVLVLLFDIEALNIAKCLDESCDDKGKLYEFTPTPLLVPKDIIDNVNVLGLTEEGRGWKQAEKNLSLTYLGVPNLFLDPSIKINNIGSNADLQKLFLNACQVNNYVNTVKTKLNTLITAYPWVLQKQLDCMKNEVPGLSTTPVNLGDIFQNKIQAFTGSTLANSHSQYLYDFIRDVADCYNDLYSLVMDLVGECGGDENRYPYHVLLGIPQTNDVSSCYQEIKFTETNYKYRSYFIPSPVVDSQFNLYEKVQHTLKRLVRVIAFFKVDAELKNIKIIPGKDYDECLSIRAIPYYYDATKFADLFRIWDYDSTRHNKLNNPRGYHGSPPQTQDNLLRNDTRKINFYRIEGHIGNEISIAQKAIDDMRNKYNLPFNTATVSIQTETNALQCAFSDLEEEYNYYRDRVLGYLREIASWIEYVIPSVEKLLKTYTDSGSTPPEVLIALYEKLKIIRERILKMMEVLSKRCLENFDYNAYKKFYAQIWEAIFDIYARSISSNTSNANQLLNILVNGLSIIFFRPIYKIWYRYQYRLASLQLNKSSSLQLLAQKITGLEHLAGVRRGETFLLVSDSVNGNVFADFNLPFSPDSCCDCKENSCDEKNRSVVSPLEKPIIMVVDYNYKEESAIIKTKALLDASQDFYTLSFDSMGFYKADSIIEKHIEVTDEEGNEFKDLSVTWENGKMIFKCNMNQERQGIIKMMYTMKGDFDKGFVQGFIYLVTIGRKAEVGGSYNVGVKDQGAYMYYPYDKRNYRKDKTEMKFDGQTQSRVIGNQKINVYTSPMGNEYMIDKDTDGYEYVKALNIKTAGIDNVPFTFGESGNLSGGIAKMNIIDKDDKPATDRIAGAIKTPDGLPLKDVKLSTASGKEVITNEKGEYSFTGLKAGDTITVEKQGFKPADIQVNSSAGGDVQLEKTPLINVTGLEKIDPSGKLNDLAAKLNITNLRNFMK